MAKSMHRTTSQVWDMTQISGEPADLTEQLVSAPEFALAFKERALRRSVSQNSTICLVPRDTDELVRVAIVFLALVRSIRSWLMTILSAAAALLVGHERCRFNWRDFLPLFLSIAFSALQWLFVSTECGTTDWWTWQALDPASFETITLRVSSVSRAESPASSCLQDEALLALTNACLIFGKLTTVLSALENMCLMLRFVFALTSSRPLTHEPTLVDPSMGLSCFVFALLQSRPFDDTERKFDSGLSFWTNLFSKNKFVPAKKCRF